MNKSSVEDLKNGADWLKGGLVLQMSPDANVSPLFRPQGQGQGQGHKHIDELSLNDYLPDPILKLTRQIACFTQSTISIKIK